MYVCMYIYMYNIYIYTFSFQQLPTSSYHASHLKFEVYIRIHATMVTILPVFRGQKLPFHAHHLSHESHMQNHI